MMPDNVTEDSDFAEYISQYTEVVLMPEEVKQIREVLEGYEFDLVFNRRGLNRMYEQGGADWA